MHSFSSDSKNFTLRSSSIETMYPEFMNKKTSRWFEIHFHTKNTASAKIPRIPRRPLFGAIKKYCVHFQSIQKFQLPINFFENLLLMNGVNDPFCTQIILCTETLFYVKKNFSVRSARWQALLLADKYFPQMMC